jgi:glycosyltransferase involved in cell wall biosynthesis
MPYPTTDGGSYSISNTACGLIIQNAAVKVIAINTPKNWIPLDSIPAEFLAKTRFEFVRVDTRFKPFKAFCNLFSNRSYFVERFWSLTFRNRLINILNLEKFDVIQLEHIYLTLYFETLRNYSSAKIVLRPQNVENIVWSGYITHIKNPLKKLFLNIALKRLILFESKMAKKVDGIIAISSIDQKIFSDLNHEIPVINIPFSFDFRQTDAPGSDCLNMTDSITFYFIGSMDWLPNVQGMKWFLNEIFPHVKSEFPDIVFRIAGKKMPRWFYRRHDKNLIVDGEVKDALLYQADKQIMIVPLLSGSGVRVKIIEAMALGKIIISTSCGAAGIPFTDNHDILIADSKDDFIRQIRKCLASDLFCNKISRNAQILAKETFDLKTNAKRMMDFFERLMIIE